MSLSKDEAEYLGVLAKRDQVPRAAKARQLLRSAMELEEDCWLSELAEKRDTSDVKRIPADEFWGKALAR